MPDHIMMDEAQNILGVNNPNRKERRHPFPGISKYKINRRMNVLRARLKRISSWRSKKGYRFNLLGMYF